MASFRRTSLGPLAVAMSLALLLGFGLARGLQATDDLRSQLDLFSQVLYLVQNNYVDTPDNQKLIKGAIDGMYSGIGISFEIRDGAIVVISPLEGTPAYRLGIRAGDRITEIENKPLPKTINNDDVFKMLRGPSGTTVEVAIQREDEPDLLRFTIER